MNSIQYVQYKVLENQASIWTGIIVANMTDFRNIGVTIATSDTAFTWTIKLKWSRVSDATNVDFGSSASQTNLWDYIQMIDNNDGASYAWDTWYAITTESNQVTNLALNVDGFNWVTAEVSWYWAGDVDVYISGYNNQ